MSESYNVDLSPRASPRLASVRRLSSSFLPIAHPSLRSTSESKREDALSPPAVHFARHRAIRARSSHSVMHDEASKANIAQARKLGLGLRTVSEKDLRESSSVGNAVRTNSSSLAYREVYTFSPTVSSRPSPRMSPYTRSSPRNKRLKRSQCIEMNMEKLMLASESPQLGLRTCTESPPMVVRNVEEPRSVSKQNETRYTKPRADREFMDPGDFDVLMEQVKFERTSK
eukprot:gb/GEZN01016724.1/.p1 GENE.gb/GEZN01016724.1/~~gb/GEZN01016724.1/.p1  ORF type:complete len:251 (+),score=24.63 gb/GEZN01016724.1/:71-754(+)